MTDGFLTVVQNEGAAQYPNEACGLLVAVGKKSVPVICKNISDDPENRFTIDPEDYIKASDMGEIIGVWHTHTNQSADPSPADIAGCNASEVEWYIVAVNKVEGEFEFSEPFVIRPNGVEMGYLERPYVWGTYDCYTLIRDYYFREYGIVLGEYQRVEAFWTKNMDFFVENYKEEGFIKLIDQEPEVGDVFIMQVSAKIPNHVGIYVGDDMILHHCHGRLSRRDVYGGMWAKHTVAHLRHKSKC